MTASGERQSVSLRVWPLVDQPHFSAQPPHSGIYLGSTKEMRLGSGEMRVNLNLGDEVRRYDQNVLKKIP